MGAEPTPPASKRDALLALLDRGLVMIHIDARKPGVDVPDYLADEHHLRLNLSYRFGLADLEVDDWGVRVTLSFRGTPHHCKIPWASLFAMTQERDERGWIWPGDLPSELLDALRDVKPPDEPNLQLVPDEASDPETAGDGPRSPPNLRLVK